MATQAPATEQSFQDQRSALHHLIRAWNRRVRLQWLVLWLPRSLLPGLIVGVALLLLAYRQPVMPVGQIMTLVAALVGAGIALLLLLVALWPRPVLVSARRFDQLFGLDERVSTALELIDGRIHTNDDLQRHQLSDTQARAQTIAASDYIPLRWDWRAWIAVVLLLVMTIVLIALMPDYQIEDGAGAVDGPREVSLADEEDLKRLTEEVAADANLSEAEREQLLEELERATDVLQNPDASPEEAMAALSEVESALQERLEEMQADMEAQRQSLAEAAEALREMSANPPEEGGAADAIDQVQTQDPSPLLEQMSEDMAAGMDEVDPQAMAEALEQAAQALEQTNPQAAEALRDAAEALRDGDTQAAQDAMQRAQESLGQQQQSLAQQQQSGDNLSEALGELQQSMSQPLQQSGSGEQGESGQQSLQQLQQPSGQPGEQGEQQSGEQAGAMGGQPGQASQPGGQPGQAPSDTQGQMGASRTDAGAMEAGGVGAGAGDTSGDTGAGDQQAAAQPGDVSQDNNPDGLSQGGFPQLYAPQRIGGEGDTDIVLEPDASGIPAREGEFSDNPAGEARVPYNQVFSDYSDAASRELDRDYIPLALRDVVRDYFASLEPGSQP